MAFTGGESPVTSQSPLLGLLRAAAPGCPWSSWQVAVTSTREGWFGWTCHVVLWLQRGNSQGGMLVVFCNVVRFVDKTKKKAS